VTLGLFHRSESYSGGDDDAERGAGIILEPVPDTWIWLDAIAGTLDKDFVEAVREQPAELMPAPELGIDDH
jgi:hypothetical protein